MNAFLNWLPWIIAAGGLLFGMVTLADASHAEAMQVEAERDRDYWKGLSTWTEGMDPRIANVSDEKISQVVRDIFAKPPNNDGPVWARLEGSSHSAIAWGLINATSRKP